MSRLLSDSESDSEGSRNYPSTSQSTVSTPSLPPNIISMLQQSTQMSANNQAVPIVPRGSTTTIGPVQTPMAPMLFCQNSMNNIAPTMQQLENMNDPNKCFYLVMPVTAKDLMNNGMFNKSQFMRRCEKSSSLMLKHGFHGFPSNNQHQPRELSPAKPVQNKINFSNYKFNARKAKGLVVLDKIPVLQLKKIDGHYENLKKTKMEESPLMDSQQVTKSKKKTKNQWIGSCCQCDKSFATVKALRMHVYKTHQNISVFICPTCGLSFLLRQMLTIHQESKHQVLYDSESPKASNRESNQSERLKARSILESPESSVPKKRGRKRKICNETNSNPVAVVEKKSKPDDSHLGNEQNEHFATKLSNEAMKRHSLKSKLVVRMTKIELPKMKSRSLRSQMQLRNSTQSENKAESMKQSDNETKVERQLDNHESIRDGKENYRYEADKRKELNSNISADARLKKHKVVKIMKEDESVLVDVLEDPRSASTSSNSSPVSNESEDLTVKHLDTMKTYKGKQDPPSPKVKKSDKPTICTNCHRTRRTIQTILDCISFSDLTGVKVKCPKCSRMCASTSLLQTHLSIMHWKCTEDVRCEISPIRNTVSTGSLIFSCTHCDKKLMSKEYLDKHLETEHGIPRIEKYYTCTNCMKQFDGDDDYYEHFVIFHSGDKYAPVEMSSQMYLKKITNKEILDRRPVACSICKLVCKNKTELIQHLSIAHSDYINLCSVCNTSFKTKNDILEHILSHDNKQRYIVVYEDDVDSDDQLFDLLSDDDEGTLYEEEDEEEDIFEDGAENTTEKETEKLNVTLKNGAEEHNEAVKNISCDTEKEKGQHSADNGEAQTVIEDQQDDSMFETVSEEDEEMENKEECQEKIITGDLQNGLASEVNDFNEKSNVSVMLDNEEQDKQEKNTVKIEEENRDEQLEEKEQQISQDEPEQIRVNSNDKENDKFPEQTSFGNAMAKDMPDLTLDVSDIDQEQVHVEQETRGDEMIFEEQVIYEEIITEVETSEKDSSYLEVFDSEATMSLKNLSDIDCSVSDLNLSDSREIQAADTIILKRKSNGSTFDDATSSKLARKPVKTLIGCKSCDKVFESEKLYKEHAYFIHDAIFDAETVNEILTPDNRVFLPYDNSKMIQTGNSVVKDLLDVGTEPMTVDNSIKVTPEKIVGIGSMVQELQASKFSKNSKGATNKNNDEVGISRSMVIKYRCLPCDQIFSSNEHLNAHKFLCHQEQSLIHICENCGEAIASIPDVNQHKCLEVKSFFCEHCDICFIDSGMLLDHNLEKHLEREGNYTCHCGKQFLTNRMLQKHTRLLHGPGSEEKTQNILETTEDGMAVHIIPIETDFLDAAEQVKELGKFINIQEYLKVRKSMRVSCSRPEKNPYGRKFCPLCKITTTAKLEVPHHYIKRHWHHGEFCEICGSIFPLLMETNHMLDHHIQCSEDAIPEEFRHFDIHDCTYKFVQALSPSSIVSIVLYHMHHTMFTFANPTKCTLCSETFNNLEDYQRHYIRNHDKTCVLCNQVFVCSTLAAGHRERKHNSLDAYLWFINRAGNYFANIFSSRQFLSIEHYLCKALAVSHEFSFAVLKDDKHNCKVFTDIAYLCKLMRECIEDFGLKKRDSKPVLLVMDQDIIKYKNNVDELASLLVANVGQLSWEQLRNLLKNYVRSLDG